MSKYKALLIDFGNVLYDISPERTIRKFAKLAEPGSEFLKLKTYDFKSIPFLHDYEKGIISSDDFRKQTAELLGISPCAEIDDAWNATLLEPKANIDRVLEELADEFPLYLLSNTNEIHHKYFAEECEPFFKYFKKRFMSYQLKMIKPCRDIFEFVAQDINIQPENILFADDSSANIETAKSLGFGTFHINDTNQTMYFLSDYLHTV